MTDLQAIKDQAHDWHESAFPVHRVPQGKTSLETIADIKTQVFKDEAESLSPATIAAMVRVIREHYAVYRNSRFEIVVNTAADKLAVESALDDVPQGVLSIRLRE